MHFRTNQINNEIKIHQSIYGFWDNKAVCDYAIDTAFDEGKLEGNKETPKQLKIFGIAIEIIAKSTGLTKEKIEKL